MGVKLTPPTRREPLVSVGNGYPALRPIVFFEDVARTIEGLPNVIDPEIDLITVSSTANNTEKINEILIAMKTAGLMV